MIYLFGRAKLSQIGANVECTMGHTDLLAFL